MVNGVVYECQLKTTDIGEKFEMPAVADTAYRLSRQEHSLAASLSHTVTLLVLLRQNQIPR